MSVGNAGWTHLRTPRIAPGKKLVALTVVVDRDVKTELWKRAHATKRSLGDTTRHAIDGGLLLNDLAVKLQRATRAAPTCPCDACRLVIESFGR